MMMMMIVVVMMMMHSVGTGTTGGQEGIRALLPRQVHASSAMLQLLSLMAVLTSSRGRQNRGLLWYKTQIALLLNQTQ